MHHKHIQGISKFVAGLVAADLISVIWLGATGFFPLQFLGITFPESAILPIALFDVAILIILVHFGWNVKIPIQSPREKTLLFLVGFVFAAVSLAHLARLVFGWDLIIGSFFTPNWISWVGIIVTGYLSYASFHFASRKH